MGVGSVGTRAYVTLLEGRDENESLSFQVKEAGASVLEGYLQVKHLRAPRAPRRWLGSG